MAKMALPKTTAEVRRLGIVLENRVDYISSEIRGHYGATATVNRAYLCKALRDMRRASRVLAGLTIQTPTESTPEGA